MAGWQWTWAPIVNGTLGAATGILGANSVGSGLIAYRGVPLTAGLVPTSEYTLTTTGFTTSSSTLFMDGSNTILELTFTVSGSLAPEA
jgi:hypothetical protein